MSTFNAYRVFEENGKIASRQTKLSLEDLTPGDVVIKAAYSSVNYKDALAATGAGKIMRRFPLVGGIDVAGTIESSSDSRWTPGKPVLVTGYDLGVSQDGGYAEYVRVPSDWVVEIPAGLTPFEAMTIGTAGFTAALSIVEMEHNGLKKESGPVIVTGATGGVGSLAVEILAGLGYKVTALTGKDDQHEFLRSIGAAEVLSRTMLQMGTKPLEKSLWAGAVDPVGGEVLAWLTRTMNYGGTIASSGLTGGTELKTTVLPFILRGVKLLGIDSALCPMPRRVDVWRRLATDMKPRRLKEVAHEVALSDLPGVFSALLAGKAIGRTVVRVGA
jgi:acrylyl-CoA reductase (NADPH)